MLSENLCKINEFPQSFIKFASTISIGLAILSLNENTK